MQIAELVTALQEASGKNPKSQPTQILLIALVLVGGMFLESVATVFGDKAEGIDVAITRLEGKVDNLAERVARIEASLEANDKNHNEHELAAVLARIEERLAGK